MCCVALVTGAALSGLQLCTEATSVFSYAMSSASVWLCYIDLTSACFLVSKPGSAFWRSSLFHGLTENSFIMTKCRVVLVSI